MTCPMNRTKRTSSPSTTCCSTRTSLPQRSIDRSDNTQSAGTANTTPRRRRQASVHRLLRTSGGRVHPPPRNASSSNGSSPMASRAPLPPDLARRGIRRRRHLPPRLRRKDREALRCAVDDPNLLIERQRNVLDLQVIDLTDPSSPMVTTHVSHVRSITERLGPER